MSDNVDCKDFSMTKEVSERVLTFLVYIQLYTKT